MMGKLFIHTPAKQFHVMFKILYADNDGKSLQMKKNRITYWGRLINQLREKKAWSQEQLAEMLETDQATISRWESGYSEPRSHHPVRERLEQLAREAKVSLLGEAIEMVKSSPFPMILVDKDDIVVAASASSGFQEDKTCLEQTPDDEKACLTAFDNLLLESGFWQTKSPQMVYEFAGNDKTRKAIVTRLTFWGEVYALVQKAW